MADDSLELLSQPLRDTLEDFRGFLRSDDLERQDAIEGADDATLAALIDAVDLDEVNQVLDDLVERPHPLSEDLEQLEGDLNSLAQAAIEARHELNSRLA